ncbi:MAG: OmpA family protein [Streptosporangiales bacterium]|nr:OmpA family protein [Streptosporangiales bacterium]
MLPPANGMLHAMPARRTLLACLTVAALLTGCSYITGDRSAGRADGKPTRDANTSSGALQTGWMNVRNWIRVNLLALDRTSPKVVTVRFRLTNTGDASFHTGDKLSYTDYGTADWHATAVTLVDAQARKHYYPLTATDGECVCSVFDDGGDIEPGESMDFFASFTEPPGKALIVMVPNTPPFLGVPVGDKPGPVEPGEGQPVRDAAKLDLEAPKILPIVGVSRAVDGSKEEEVDDKEVEVRLSSDVLFALNKADLSPRARQVLTDVAARIDRSKAAVVKVDGYTDDTGNDAINNPLSRRRAAAVRDALTGLVTRDGVTYQVAGHGSADPVAPNTSEENRKRNRRVSVTFAR